MRVFLSWSGERSGQIAKAMKVWLTDVLHALEPWVSFEDIDKGARWSLQLAQGLENTGVGIVCLTPENLLEPWILFEAGTLAKFVESSRVCTYLYQLRPTDVHGPLAAFQATEANRADTQRLVRMLNGLLGEHARPDEQVNRAFEKWWPELERTLLTIRQGSALTKERRSDRQLLEEILALMRRQERASSDAEWAVHSADSEFGRLLKVDPREVTDLLEALADRRADETVSADPHSIDQPDALDGVWVGEWTGGVADADSKEGTAKLLSHSRWLVGVEVDNTAPTGPFLLVARRRDDGVFVGRYVNLRAPRDSTAWVGRAVTVDRIYGQWKCGRWDFRRKRSGN